MGHQPWPLSPRPFPHLSPPLSGLVLTHSPDVSSDLHPSKVVERPKVIYNDATGKFVMWMHIDRSVPGASSYLLPPA